MIDREQWESVGDTLESYVYIFHKMWEMGVPTSNSDIPTACITFDRTTGDHLGFEFNPKFWNSLNRYERAFICAHEMLHIILNHGTRGKDSTHQDASNIAMDVVVNEMLLREYGFDASKLSKLLNPSKDGSNRGMCTIDSVFNGNAQYGMNYEYYFNRLKQTMPKVEMYLMFGDHSNLPSANSVFKKLPGNLPKDVKEMIKEMTDLAEGGLEAGTGAGNRFLTKNVQSEKKLTWYELFKKFAVKLQTKPDEHEQWVRLHRRMDMMDSSFFIPSEHHDVEVEKPDKIPVWLFLDVSGSCMEYRDYFIKAYNSIPKDKFDVKVYSFDTRVLEIEVRKDKLYIYGGGGTSFTCIENFIKGTKKTYPKLVLIFTDGYGTKVTPIHPDRWHFFLADRMYCTTSYVPRKATVKYLSDIVD